MKFQYFDAHTHVQFAAYGKDMEAVIARAAAAGVGMITVGTQRDTSLKAVEVARAHENVWAAVGLHPVHTGKSFHDAQELGGVEATRGFTPLEISRSERLPPSAKAERGFLTGFTGRGEEFDYEYYRKLAEDPKVVAIGECGLDFFRIEEGGERIKEKQREAFVAQIKLAHEVQKPLMIHCRSAFSDLIQLLVTNYQLLITDRPGIIHFFSGTVDEAKRLLDMGFYFTFGGVVTYPPKKNGTDYEAIIEIVPMDKILSETDAPYVAPAPYRGKRNEPAYVVEVVKKLAEIKEVSPEVISEQILENTRRVFRIRI